VFENNPLVELAIGRSTVRQRILALLMYGQETRLHLREIQRRVGTSPGTASRELARLVAAGLVDREAEGSQVYFRASSSPIATMMRHLLLAQADRPAATPTRIPTARRIRPETAATGGDEAITPPTVEDAEAVQPHETAEPDEAADVAEPAETAEVAEPADVAEPDQTAEVAEPADVAEPDQTANVAGPVEPAGAAPDPLALVVAARFSAAIRPLYGDRLKAVFLYGARATGPAAEDADVELLVVLDHVPGYGEELERTSAICAQLSYELGLVVSRLFVAERNWTGPTRGFVAVLPAAEHPA
jgi:DNA-binding transcriptional ArsR family regulator